MRMNILLTSAGFEDMDGIQKKNIVNCFRTMLDKPFHNAKVLFIPTAAIDQEAKRMVDKCRSELLDLSILPENITVYDIGGSLNVEDALAHDILYFTGGNTRHLLQRIRETGSEAMINKMTAAGKVYIGVSAGSLIATPNIGDPHDKSTEGLGLIKAYLRVHCPEHQLQETGESIPVVYLTDRQAVAVTKDGFTILED